MNKNENTNITLSQADKLKALCHYYKLSPTEVMDWSIKVLWENQREEEIGLIALLELFYSPSPKNS